MYIYKITNKLNGKIYIGKHASKRKNYWGSGKIIKLAIKKHGKENFIKEVIEYCTNKNELSSREIYWIKYFDSTNKLIGYNITNGGDGNDTINNGFWLGKKLSDEHKKNISLHHADMKGDKNPMFGKTHNDSVKENLRKLKTGLKYSIETKQKQSEKTKGNKNPNSKLTDDIVLNIRKEYNEGEKTETLAKKYKVNKPCIWKIVHNYTWKHLIQNTNE